jgi:hypothetical protein
MFAKVAGYIHPKASMLHAGQALQFPSEQIALNGKQHPKSATLTKSSMDVSLDAVIERALQLNRMSVWRGDLTSAMGSKADIKRLIAVSAPADA